MSGMTDDFTDWLTREMPAGTVIGDPAWWATRIAARLRGEAAPEGPAVAWLDGDFAACMERNGSAPAWAERRKARGGAVAVYTSKPPAAPVAGDAVAKLPARWRNLAEGFRNGTDIGNAEAACLIVSANELEAALAQDRASQAGALSPPSTEGGEDG